MRLPRMAWGKRYGTFSGWGMAAGKVEVLLVVGGFEVDGGAEVRLVSKDVNIQEYNITYIRHTNCITIKTMWSLC